MKKLILSVATVAIIAFASCSKDDDGGSKKDCFDCSLMGVTVKYCHTKGDDFYTVSVAGQTEEVPLDGAEWSSVKAGLKQLCQ